MKYLIPIIIFSGFFINLLLQKIAKEELKSGKLYFKIIKKTVLFLLIAIILSLARDYVSLFLGVIIGFILAIFLSIYLFIGFPLAISFISNNLVLLTSSLTFIYSILPKKFSYNYFLFFIPLIFLSVNIPIDFLIGVTAGSLFNYFIRK